MAAQPDKQSMTLRNFTRNLRRGIGSAIIELQNNPGREIYRDVVMKSCLKDIAYDTQVEGTKGYYLYAAIKTFDNHEEFLNRIAEKFSKRLYWRLSEQLYDMLCCFSSDGYTLADEAIEKKYADLKQRLPLMRDYDHNSCEREQLEKLMIKKMNGGFGAFKQCVNDMGEMIIKRGNDDCLWYDWFLTNAEERYGKGIYDYIKSSDSEKVVAFNRSRVKSESNEGDGQKLKLMTANDFAQSYRFKQGNNKEDRMTIEQLIDRANELATDKDPYPFRISPFSRKFAKQAKKKELKTLANMAIEESSIFIKAALLRTFSFTDFPLDIGLLLQYAHSDDEYLREIVAKTLSRLKDNRIHALALQLFNDGQAENALSLLESNFEIEDEGLIRKYILCSRKVTYDMTVSISEIYQKNKTSTCRDILLHFYQNVECSHCRCNIVELMISNEVIPKNRLEECQHDSYEETRESAKKHLIAINSCL